MRIKPLHILVISLGMIGLSIYNEFNLRQLSYEQMLDEVYQLQRADSELNKYILLTRFRVVDSYEEINRNKEIVELIIQNFIERFKSDNPLIYSHVVNLRNAVVDKAALLEVYERDNVKLLDSYDKFIHRFEQAFTNIKFREDESLQKLFKYTMLYMDAGGTKLYDSVEEQLAIVKHNKEFTDQFPDIIDFSKVVLKSRLEVKELYQRIYLVPTTQYLTVLHEAYKNELNSFLTRYVWYRYFLYSCSIVFIVILGFAFMRIQQSVDWLKVEIKSRRKAQQSLAIVNRELEKRVEMRTAELVENNQELSKALESLKDAQQQIIAQEKMASIGLLAAGISHEIKNPLNFINNFSQISLEMYQELKEHIRASLMAGKVVNPDLIQELIDDLSINCEKVVSHGKRADNIVKNMLRHSEGKDGEKEKIDVNLLLEEYLNLAYHGKRSQNKAFNVKIIKDFDDTLPLISLYPQAIGRVFLNVIDNGLFGVIERMARQEIDYKPILTVRTRFFQLQGQVRIEIEDNGIGIPADYLTKIFQPFFTTKPSGKGTGLGLSMGYDIVVNQHKGSIFVESQVNEFTRFVIILPCEGGVIR